MRDRSAHGRTEPLSEEQQSLDLRWARALSNPVRVAILRALVDSDLRSVGELASKLGVSLHMVRYHLGRLEELGFVACSLQKPPGRRRRHTYGLRDRTEAILAIEQSGSYPRARRRRSSQESKDLRALGRLLRAEREKRGVELIELARRLDIGSLYLEQIERGEADPPATLLSRCARELGARCGKLIEAWSR